MAPRGSLTCVQALWAVKEKMEVRWVEVYVHRPEQGQAGRVGGRGAAGNGACCTQELLHVRV